MHISDEKLAQLLEESGVVTKEIFQSANEEAKRFNQRVTEVLIGRQIITESFLAEVLQSYFGVPLIDLRKSPIEQGVLLLIPEAFAKSKNVVAYALDEKGKSLKVAMTDPFDFETIEFLRASLGYWIDVSLTTSTSIRYALRQYKNRLGANFNELIQENLQKTLSITGVADLSKMAEAVPIANIVDAIMNHGVALNASDIHFEPLDRLLLVRFRIDGVLHEILTVPVIISAILVARVKILSALQIDEHRIPQDGRFGFETEEGVKVDVRVNVMPVMHGEKVEMRLLKGASRPLTLKELGVSDDSIKLIQSEIDKPHGMALVTGPTGHGKTTTLYTILHMLNKPEVNITTVEDPIEYEIARVNQTQVNVKAGITFANGLRALLRQNPDVIMVGEIRDNETADISVHAALTGHLVLSTLHTNDAPSALPRLLDMGAAPFLLASTINVIIAQRLVRRICTHCIESYQISAEARKLIQQQFSDLHFKKLVLPRSLYHGRGCKICSFTGYVGQVGIFEIMVMSEKLRQLALKQASSAEIRKQAIADGMVTMLEDGLEKITKGVVALEEVLRVVRE